MFALNYMTLDSSTWDVHLLNIGRQMAALGNVNLFSFLGSFAQQLNPLKLIGKMATIIQMMDQG